MVRFLTVVYVLAAAAWFGSYSAVEIAPSTAVHIVPVQQKVNEITSNSTDALMAFGGVLVGAMFLDLCGKLALRVLKRMLGIKAEAKAEAKTGDDKAKTGAAQVVQVALTQEVADTATRRALRKLLTPALIEAIEVVNEKKKQAKKEAEKPAEAKPADKK